MPEPKPPGPAHILSRVSPHLQALTGRCASFLTSAVIGVLLGFVVMLSTPGPRASAQVSEGLIVSSDTLYSPDPVDGHVDVIATFSLTNVQADEQIGDRVRSYFFSTWTIALPVDATDFVATSGGTSLGTAIEPNTESDSFVIGIITLPFDLNYEQTVNLQARYSIPGGEPRDSGAARVNTSFLSFPVWVLGDPGKASLRVDVPAGFDLEFQGTADTMERVRTGNADYFEAREIAAPNDFFGRVFGRNDEGLVAETAELESGSAIVRSWPDDPEWAELVVDAIENDVPVIEELTGLPWPAGDIEVIETVTPYLYGYAGWYNADSGLIEVGDQLDRDIILHELGHAWFNDELIGGRWIVEGLAEETAALVIAHDSAERPRPSEPDLSDPIRDPLQDWASPFLRSAEEAFDYEQYHYNASWWVLYQLTDEIGVEGLSDVLVAIDSDQISFVGEGDPELWTDEQDWRYFLDMLEERAGAERAEQLFRTYVLNDSSVALLDARSRAHTDYDQLLSQSGSFGSPLVIREHLARWSFDDAEALIDSAAMVLDLRDTIDRRAAELNVTLVQLAEVPYEMADSASALADAASLARDQLATLDELGERRSEITSAADELNLEVRFDSMEFEAAVDRSSGLLGDLEALAERRSEATDTANVLGLTMPQWPTGQVDAVLSDQGLAVTERLDSLALIAAAEERSGQPRSLLERVGLLGQDPGTRVDAARAAFERGETAETVRLEVAQVDRLLAGAERSGRSRLAWSATGLAVALLAFAGFRFRRNQHGAKNKATLTP